MGQVSGKGSGYYGCLGAVKRACSNKIIVPRRLAERRVLAALRERISDVVSLQYVLGRVEMEVKRLHAHLPQEIKDKRGALVIEERRIANFIAFIGDGKGTRALASALSEAEARAGYATGRACNPRGGRGRPLPTAFGGVGDSTGRSARRCPSDGHHPVGPGPTTGARAGVPTPGHARSRSPLLSSRDRRPDTGAPPGPGRRFEFIATVEAGGIEPHGRGRGRRRR